MVVTIEPGLYVIPLLLPPLRDFSAATDIHSVKVERLASHGGIRSEDNVRVTRHGADNLTP